MFQFLRCLVLIAVVFGLISLLMMPAANADLVSDLAACISVKEADKRLACFDKAIESLPTIDVGQRSNKADEKSPAVITPDFKNRGAVLGDELLSPRSLNPDPYSRAQEEARHAEQAAQAARGTSYDRQAYKSELYRAFLEAGISLEIYVINAVKKTRDDDEPPALEIWGYFDRAFVYNVIKRRNIIDEAGRLGFKTVSFRSKGSSGVAIFNLSTGGQCRGGLCF